MTMMFVICWLDIRGRAFEASGPFIKKEAMEIARGGWPHKAHGFTIVPLCETP